MPFQLDTSIYGGGGEAVQRPQRSQLGMLGDLMDFQARQANLEGQQESRRYINEQRQGAIEKQQRDAAQYKALRELPPDATREQLVRVVGPEEADKIIEQRLKVHTAKLGRVASVLGSIKALPPDQQEQAFYDAQHGLASEGTIGEEDMSEYSPAHLDQAQQAALTAIQQVQESTAAKREKTAADAETRLREKADREAAGETADAAMKVRAQYVPNLQAAQTKEAYDHIYKQYPEQFRGTIPTPDEAFGSKRADALRKLDQFSVSPADWQQHKDRQAALAQGERHFQETEKRLREQAGGLTITNAMHQSALKGRAADQQRLQERVSDAIRLGKPLSKLAIEDEELRIEQAYSDELRLPPSLRLADQRKDVKFRQLEEEIAQRNAYTKDEDGKQTVAPRNPMGEEEIKRRKAALQNTYRSWLQMGPDGEDSAAPTRTPTPPRSFLGTPTPNRPAPSAGVLGDLMDAPPPPPLQFGRPPQASAAPPAPPMQLQLGQRPPATGSPAAQDPRAAEEARSVWDEMMKLRKGGDPQLLQAKRDRYRQLTGT